MQATRRFALLAALLGFSIGVGIMGCERSDGNVGPLDDAALAAGNDELGMGAGPFAGLTIEQIDARLHLSDAQKAQLRDALDKLQSERKERWGRRGGHGGAGGRGGPDGRGRHDGQIGRSGPASDPPIVGFIEDASKILSPEQFREMASLLKETREARIGRTESHHRVRDGEEAMPFGLGGRAAAYLGLTEAQQAQLKPIVQRHMDEIRGLREQVRAGGTTGEQAREQIRAVRIRMRDEAKSVLTAEQWEKVESFRRERAGEAIDSRVARLGEHLARRADLLTRILGLDATQAQQVRSLLLETVPARTEVLNRLRAGMIEPEDAAASILEIDQAWERKIPPILTSEQSARWEAMRDLLPMRGR
jgi:Spy/CpxP family protein refolding chaperone